MNLDYLHNFLMVTELGSIAEAARRLGLSPTTLAQRLKALEASVGTPLLVRAGHTVKPTLAGTRITENAQNILLELHRLKASAFDTAPPSGPLRLGTMHMGFILPVLKQWADHFPNIAINIERATNNMLYAMVLDGEIDAALIARPAFDLPKGVIWTKLKEESLIMLTPATLKVDDIFESLAREPYIRLDPRVFAGEMADEYLRQKGIYPQIRFELQGIDDIARLVEEGLGISLLPDWSARDLHAAQALRRWPLPKPCPSRILGMVSLKSGTRSKLVDSFAEMAEKLHSA
ncbi:MAG: LysR family transcriptional regulator [Propionivibrio sp.]|nr:LysR family transcriptional regulator [Propionivibrio sp.]